MWIHDYNNWTGFSWNAESLLAGLTNIHRRGGHLLGQMDGLGFALKQEASLKTLINDVVKSSAIEGEVLNPDAVRSSLARRLGLDTAGLRVDRNVDGIVTVMLDATQGFANPLTEKRLCGWQAALFPTGRSGLRSIKVGGWRTRDTDPMQVVSGAIGRQKIHFEAPSADRLGREMSDFIAWFNKQNKIDPILKAGIAHLWFVTLHPFEDGNGRIARALCDMALAQSDGIKERFYSLSSQFESERADYYNQLEKQQRGSPDITEWLYWFLGCLGRALASAETSLDNVIFKSKLWDKINQNPTNERQKRVINRMLEDDFVGFISTSKYAKMGACSPDTALRDIQDLTKRGILIQNDGGGRSVSYRLPASLT